MTSDDARPDTRIDTDARTDADAAPAPAAAVGTMTVGVLGLGAVGARVARRLVSMGHSVLVSDVREPLARTIANDLAVAHVGTEDLFAASQVVVVATPSPHHPLAFDLVRRGVHVVSTSDDLSDTESLMANTHHAQKANATLVAGASMSPGLSGLLARQLADSLDEVDEVHVAAHGTGGPSCARQHHRALAGTALVWHDGEWVTRRGGSGRELFWFPEPIGAYDCYRAELSDPLLLHLAFPEARRLSARLSATRRDRFTSRLPMLSPPHSEGGIGGLRVEVRGRRGRARVTLVAGVAERSAIVTGVVAAAVASSLVHRRFEPGLAVLGATDVPNTAVLDSIADGGIALQEYVGSDA